MGSCRFGVNVEGAEKFEFVDADSSLIYFINKTPINHHITINFYQPIGHRCQIAVKETN
jgi:hypothetical protein